MKVISFFGKLLQEFPKLFIIWSGLLILQGLFAGASLLSIAPIIDTVLRPEMAEMSIITSRFVKLSTELNLPATLPTYLFFFLTFLILKNIFFVVARYTILQIRYALAMSISQKTFTDFYRARWLFFSQTKQGTLLNTFTREITIVAESLGQISMLCASFIQLLVYIAVPVYIAWEITTTCLILAILFAAPFIFLNKLNYRLGKKNTTTANEMMEVLQENFSAVKVILGFGNQHQNIKRYLSAFDKHRQVSIKFQTLGMIPPYVYEPLGILALVITFMTSQMLSILIADTLIVVWGLKNAIPLVGQLVNKRNSIIGFIPSFEQVMKMRKQARDLEQVSGEKQFARIQEVISLNHVSFTYPGRKNTLSDINLAIPKGKMIAIVGESGSGKSTLIDMLLGFHSADQGEVRIDNIPLSLYDMDSYRQRIGYVPQEAVLFNMSVRENLLWAQESATETEMWDACQQANAKGYIKELPDQLDTLIGDRGVQLSGGQCQRLALARAILRKPELLILDEATSALDTESERLIQKAIENLAKKTTTIIIAHRLSTIIHAHHIYVLKDGKIFEDGNYESLVQKNGLFKKMVQLQNLEKIA